MTEVRTAEPADLKPLASLWWSGWRDGHEGLLPEALTRLRTLESFEDRMAAALPKVRVLGPVGAPLGFHLLKDDELYQFYLAAEARGTGAAARLMADAEDRLAQAGVETAWLACAILATPAPRGSTRSPAGPWHGSRTCRSKPPRASFRWRSGATKSAWPARLGCFRAEPAETPRWRAGGPAHKPDRSKARPAVPATITPWQEIYRTHTG